jgi:DNA sulfur modification protein DndB
MVNEARARKIAATVLAQNRTFPNAIVLATDTEAIDFSNGKIAIPKQARFLVIDGQHRLWAQEFSGYEAPYACLIHIGLDERKMAELFLEINDNQKRVPSSLRWDLVRLVRPEDEPEAMRAADLVYELATEEGSPLFQRVDLTGERKQITLKQGSVAPAIKSIVRAAPFRTEPYESQHRLLRAYFSAIRERDVDGWEDGKGPLYQARVVRALIQVLPEAMRKLNKPPKEVEAGDFYRLLKKLDLESLSDERIRAQHGNAGIAAITKTIREQIFN